ncbi:MAG: PAS domain S-box protein [Desulfatiglans sp.]|jgi:PAS domain S-box-containing protein|nr:PAS domain S-box protein [Desulfatiglans sp.]
MVKKRSEKTKHRGDSPNNDLAAARAQLSNERYQAFVENIEEGVYEADIDGNFLYFNNSLCKILGYPKEEVHFRSFSKFMEEEYAQKVIDTFREIYHSGKGISDLLWRIIDKRGKTKIIELSAQLIVNRKGEKVGFRGIVRDMTSKFAAQQALLESENRLWTLLDFVPYPTIVFNLDGRVLHLNPAFTETFGWTLEELAGRTIPYVPPGREKELSESLRRLFEDRIILRHETQRLTKDGRILDVVMRAAVYSDDADEPGGELVILRNITREKKLARNNEALLRISMALPEYPALDDLLHYISGEVKNLIGAEGAMVILLDEEQKELYFKSAAHDDSIAEDIIKEIRFSADKGVSGHVIQTGKPIIVPDASKEPNFYSIVDEYTGLKTKSLLVVPLKSRDRTIGVLSVRNKKDGDFDEADIELLNMIAGTVALSIENARFSDELKDAYQEVTSLNRAKDKVINHLSHELKTPLAVLSGALKILKKTLSTIPKEKWEPTIKRANRNLDRMLEMQYQIEDIMRYKHYDTHHILSLMLDECADELVSLLAEEIGEGPVIEKVRKRIDETFDRKSTPSKRIRLDRFVPEVLDSIRPLFTKREVELIERFDEVQDISLPEGPMEKVVVGLIKNGMENTPDEGRMEISVSKKRNGVELSVRDYGVGITEENQIRIFEGFFHTQESMDYSSKRPYDFNAGGRGIDLLRLKIFSERHDFKIDMVSSRCRYIPRDSDICPGRISQCGFVEDREGCFQSGETTFTIFFPNAGEGECPTTVDTDSKVHGIDKKKSA